MDAEGQGMDKSTDVDLADVLGDLEASYWVPLLKTPFEALEEAEVRAKTDCPPLYQAFSAFHSNLSAARDLLEFPYALIAPLLPEVRQSYAIANPMRDEGQSQEAFWAANPAMAMELVAKTLRGSRSHLGRTNPHLQRLMHQAILLIWSALETFTKQAFVACINEKPALFSIVSKNPQLKEKFGIGQASWLGLLESHGFDLRGKLGTIVGADRDFSSPQLIKDIFPTIFAGAPGPGFPLPVFQPEALWKMGNRRHLVAHRCGVVDKEYLDKTGDDTQELGTLLKLRGRDVAEGMGAAASYAILIYGSARYCWPRPETLSERLDPGA